MNFSYWEKEYLIPPSDYLIVGMGLVGLQTAINLKEKHPKANVSVVDRHGWGLGASTRNAGFGCFANVSEIIDDLKNDTAENVYQTVGKRYRGLKLLREKYGDKNMDYQTKGSQEIFTKLNSEALAQGIDSIRGINTILDQELGLDRVFTYTSKSSLPNVIGSIQNSYEGQLNTGRLYQTIYHHAQTMGIQLWGGLEVKSWDRTHSFHVKTQHNITLKTKHLILCTNAFTPLLVNENIKPCRGQVIVSEPIDNLPIEGLYHYDNGYYYWRDIDHRILLGGARNIDIDGETSFALETNDKVVRELERFMEEQIVGRPVKIDYKWSGIMGMGKSQQKNPIIKEIEPQLFIAARLGGMGVALSASVAEDLVNLM
ncbi:FAD-binding oxidoreductase [Bacteroidia bacterium]|jgi:gamma-glutamylputrescine oxidase|nr:FAD-binding oxidoreductase [Bacteroidia bacterium]